VTTVGVGMPLLQVQMSKGVMIDTEQPDCVSFYLLGEWNRKITCNVQAGKVTCAPNRR
jgi:hypothetical protein